MDEQGFSIKDVLAIFRRRLRLIVFTSGSIVLLSIFVAAVLKDKFQAHAVILVEPQSISKKLVETGQEDQDVMNRLHLMKMQILSRSRLSKVIDEFKLYPAESESKTREEVIELMKRQINVEPLIPEIDDPDLKRKLDIHINTFQLTYNYDDASIAAAVTNRLANDFIDEHIKERVQSSGDTADFVDSELQRMTGRTREIEAQIAQVKAQNPGSLPDDVVTNQRQIEQSFQSLSIAEEKLAEAQSDEAFYRQQATVARESGLGGGGNAPSNVVLSPNQRLQLLENNLSELRGHGATDKHPDVVATLAEMEQVRDRIAHGDANDVQDKSPTSVAEQQALAEAQRASLRVESGEKEVARIRKEIDDAQARLAATPRVAEQLDALEREYKHLSESFQDYSNKRLEASVAANMERRQKGEQFRVLESAFPPPKPTWPNRLLIVLIGVFLGVGAGAGIAFLLDAGDSSYHDPRVLQQSLRVPVLASIPGILLDADRARIRRRIFRDTVAAIAVSGVMLTVSAVSYVIVNRPHLLHGGEENAAPPAAPAAAPAPAPAPDAAPPAEDAGQAG